MTTSPGIGSTSPLLTDLACAWISVSDVELAERILTRGVGLTVLAGGVLPARTPLPGEAGAPVDRDWIMLGSPDESFGRVCVLRGSDRVVGGGLPRGWDSVEIVVDDVDAAATRLARHPGVLPLVAPFTADLRDLGSNMHRSAVWRMPWGTHLILTCAVTAPQGRAFPATRRRAGRVFEVHVRTDRFVEARRLYADVLGPPSIMDVHFLEGAVHNAWSLPPASLSPCAC